MKIKYKNFRLEPGTGEYTFDLIREIDGKVSGFNRDKYPDLKVGDKTGEKRDDIVGYDYSLTKAVSVMIKLILKDKEGTVSLSEWLAAYVREQQQLRAEIEKAQDYATV